MAEWMDREKKRAEMDNPESYGSVCRYVADVMDVTDV
jgi:hypothetical protein